MTIRWDAAPVLAALHRPLGRLLGGLALMLTLAPAAALAPPPATEGGRACVVAWDATPVAGRLLVIGFKGMGGDAPGPRLPKGRIPPHITKWWVAVLSPGSIGQDCEVSAQFELEGVGKLKLLHASWRRGERQIRECIFISDDGLHYKGEEMGVCQYRGDSEWLITLPGQD